MALSAPEIVRGLVFLALAPLLGPEAYGLMGLAAVVIAVATLLLRDGWTTAILGRHRVSDELLTTAFWTLCLLSLALLPPVLAGGWLLGRVFAEPSLPVVVAALFPALLAEGLSVPARSWLLRNRRSWIVAVASGLAAIAAGVGALLAALAGWGVWALVLFNLLLALITASVLVRWSAWRPGRHFAPAALRPVLVSATKISAGNAVIVLEQIALRGFAAGVFGTAGLGALMLARRVVEVMVGATSVALGRASLIGFARDPAGSAGRRRTLMQGIALGLLLGGPMAAMLWLFGEAAVSRLAGPEWRDGAPLVRASALLVLVLPVNAVLAQWHFSHDHAGRELSLRILGAVLLVAFLPLVFPFGLEGVVLAMAARSWILLFCRSALIFWRAGVPAALGIETVRSISHPEV